MFKRQSRFQSKLVDIASFQEYSKINTTDERSTVEITFYDQIMSIYQRFTSETDQKMKKVKQNSI